MSKYTTQLRYICLDYGRDTVENWFKDYELTDYLTNEQIEVISQAGMWSKDKLATQIVDEYFMREIGLETPYLFKHMVKSKMKKIMAKKLPIIYSMSIEYNPLINVDYTETLNRGIQRQGSTNSTSSGNNSNLSISSNTPMGQINKQEILEGKYASNTVANEGEGTSTDTSNSQANDTETYTKNIKGNSGVLSTNQKLIEQYRQLAISINEEIIDELAPLFMAVY